MNGQRMLQTEQGGEWQITSINKAGALKPAVYNLYLANPADKASRHDGQIVHIEGDKIYQAVGNNVGVRKSFVTHDKKDFDIVPAVGAERSITYGANGKATATNLVQAATRGRHL